MRVSDYVIQFLRDKYLIDTVFTVSGGGCIFLIDSLGSTDGVKYIATHHEQAAAIAAEGYSRMNNKLGACVVTSGPGGTNAITGVLCSWLDSIPVIILSGQVNKEMTTNYRELPELRQLGDQEFNIIESVKNMTKYAVQVNDHTQIREHLEKACMLAVSGRPGPVWVDIPLNVQSANIDPENLQGVSEEWIEKYTSRIAPTDEEINLISEKLNKAKKPLMIVGNGIRLADAVQELKVFLNKTNIPVISAINGNDLVTNDYLNYFGRFGTHAQICANKLLSECDFLLSVGSRLYVRQTGYNFQSFASQAYKCYVDVDQNELSKPTLFPDLKIHADAKVFLEKINKIIQVDANVDWINFCKDVRATSPTVLQKHRDKTKFVSHYHFIEKLQHHIPQNFHVVTSDGSANVVTMQVLNLRPGQRLITNTGCAPMGYGLPAALGAAVHHNVVCIEGDGSLHLNIHELQTVKHNNLPVKIILLNNDGYLSIKISQKTFFNSKYVASEKNSGVSFPKFEQIVKAYELPYYKITAHEDIDSTLSKFFAKEGPGVCEVFTDPDEYHEPKVVATLDSEGKFLPGELKNIQWIN